MRAASSSPLSLLRDPILCWLFRLQRLESYRLQRPRRQPDASSAARTETERAEESTVCLGRPRRSKT